VDENYIQSLGWAKFNHSLLSLQYNRSSFTNHKTRTGHMKKNLLISGCIITVVALLPFAAVYADPAKPAVQQNDMTQPKENMKGQDEVKSKSDQTNDAVEKNTDQMKDMSM
jgi:hypothetical protein